MDNVDSTPLRRASLFGWDSLVDHSQAENNFRKCRGILLKAGADPLIPDNHQEWNAVKDAIRSGTYVSVVSRRVMIAAQYLQECLKLILDHGKPFIDMAAIHGTTTLIHLVESELYKRFQDEFSPANSLREKLRLLIERGTNINGRDVYGRTCLQIAIRGLKCQNIAHDAELISMLLQSGADVDSEDDNGRSISDDAYGEGGGFWGYRGDLLDSVLTNLGHDILERRRRHPRRPLYRDGYGREDFKNLWKGRELDCPYYNDPPCWPDLGYETSEEEQNGSKNEAGRDYSGLEFGMLGGLRAESSFNDVAWEGMLDIDDILGECYL